MGKAPRDPPQKLRRVPPGPITSVCFSKDGQCVLAASLDSTLRLLDKDTGELLGEYGTPPPPPEPLGEDLGGPPAHPDLPPPPHSGTRVTAAPRTGWIVS